MRAALGVGLIVPFLAGVECRRDPPVTTPATPAGAANPGFATPTTTTRASEWREGMWTDVGAADWGCLDTPRTDPPPTQAIALTGDVRDYQTGNGVGGAEVTALAGVDLRGDLGRTLTSDVAATRGEYSVTVAPLPAGATRYGFGLRADGWLRTYQLGVALDPARPSQRLPLEAWSVSTLTALPAFIGQTYAPTDALVTGTIEDCAGRRVAGAIATVSTASEVPRHAASADTYYFSAGATSLPVRHATAPATRGDGRFLVLGVLPQEAPSFVQVWGFPDDPSLTAGRLRLLAELAVTLEVSAVTAIRLEPHRSR
jgi:hypothetical protein